MIAVSKTNLHRAAIKHYDYFKTNCLSDLETKCRSGIFSSTELAFLTSLLVFHKEIIIGDPSDLVGIIEMVENFKTSDKAFAGRLRQKNSRISSAIKSVFNYDRFTQEYPPSWGAYTLTKELGVDICPYCNRQYISTLYSKPKDGKTRPDLDHFFDKKTHPYLALSLYNLVPCCKVCNSSFKHSKKFDISTHVHPFREGFNDDLKFSIKFIKEPGSKETWDLNLFYGLSPNFEITLKDRPGSDGDFIRRARNNAEVFKIEELYNFHRDIIFELIQKSVIYDDLMIADIFQQHSKLFKDEEDVKKMVIGNYTADSDLHKRPLAKCMKDISEELGLLK